jgi:hypothetical protein
MRTSLGRFGLGQYGRALFRDRRGRFQAACNVPCPDARGDDQKQAAAPIQAMCRRPTPSLVNSLVRGSVRPSLLNLTR